MDFRQADLRTLHTDAVMAAERKFETATKGGAMNDGDDGLRCVLDLLDDVGKEGLERGLSEFLDVGAGDKGASGAIKHGGFRVGFGLKGCDCIDHAGADGIRGGVDRGLSISIRKISPSRLVLTAWLMPGVPSCNVVWLRGAVSG